MSVASEISAVFGWRNGKPNIADHASNTSVAIAAHIFSSLNITRESTESGQTLGNKFKDAVAGFLKRRLADLAPDRSWIIDRRPITDFAQYAHLAHIKELAEKNPTLQSSLGTDYLIRPDITIGFEEDPYPHLHAAVSCKWTIRSDRVQNIRHEAVVMTRHRRGRQPHIVAVTAEPLPSRLAAIARGTGELDCVYHATLSELWSACPGGKETDMLDELQAQDRLRPLESLPEVIAYY